MEDTGLTEFLSAKLKLLEEQRHKLHATVDSHIQRVLSLSQAWMGGNKEDSNGKTLTFRDISLMIEDTTLLMVVKCQGFTDDGEVSAVSSVSESTSVPSLATVTNVLSPDVSKSALSRIQVLEEAVSSLSTNMSKLSESQLDVNLCKENLTDKLSQVDENQRKSSKETEECLKQLTDKQTKTEMEQNQKVEDLENRLQMLENAQSEMDEKILQGFGKTEKEPNLEAVRSNLEKQRKDFTDLKDRVEEVIVKKIEDVAQKVSKQEKMAKRVQKVEQRIETVEEREAENVGRLEDFEKKLDKELGSVDKRLDKKCGNFDKKVGAVEKKFDKEFEAVGKRLEAVDEEFAAVDEKLDNFTVTLENLEAVEKNRKEELAAVKKKTDQLETSHTALSSSVENQKLSFQELTTTVESHSSTLETLKSNRETDAANLQRILNKVRLLKREKNKALEKVGKQFDDVGLKYQMVCQIVADRLVPLERLREILNKKAKSSEENVEKLHKVVKDVAALVPKVSQLENQLMKATVGVTATLDDIKPAVDSILDGWTLYAGNNGGHFDLNTGMFTAPLDGVYAVSLFMWQVNKGGIQVYVKKVLSGNTLDVYHDKFVFELHTEKEDSSDNDLTLFNMKAGDKLYVYVDILATSIETSHFRLSVFSVQ